MTNKKVTYNTLTHKIVPIEPTIEMIQYAHNKDCVWTWEEYRPAYKNMVAAAPEYQERVNMRKAIQIQVTYIPETSSFASAVIQTVVCDDGTMWHKDAISDDWEQVANIPQPAPEGDKP